MVKAANAINLTPGVMFYMLQIAKDVLLRICIITEPAELTVAIDDGHDGIFILFRNPGNGVQLPLA